MKKEGGDVFSKSQVMTLSGLGFMSVYATVAEGSLEVKLPTIWTDEKQRREEAERRERLEERRVEERRCRCAKG